MNDFNNTAKFFKKAVARTLCKLNAMNQLFYILPGKQAKLANAQVQGIVSLLVVLHFTVLSDRELLVVCPSIH